MIQQAIQEMEFEGLLTPDEAQEMLSYSQCQDHWVLMPDRLQNKLFQAHLLWRLEPEDETKH
jgi:hypothetical protein